jgi:predicted metal-dependent HD superfamily phosphohydrolase
LEEDLFEELFGLYGQAHRHYHTIRHVEECFREFDAVSPGCAEPVAVEMALWYHDIVYEPSSSINERLSANKAIFDCARLGVEDNGFQTLIADLVLATRHVADVSGDAAFVADIDLAILGSPWERFSEYERQIRQEYASVPDKEFIVGRSQILDGFFRRKHIYQTDVLRDKYEKTARGNIARSLMRLRSGHV